MLGSGAMRLIECLKQEGTLAFSQGGPRTFGAHRLETSVSSLAALRVTIEPLEEACVIRAAGSLVSDTLERVRSPLDGARSDRRTTLLDLSGVSSIDSAGLGVLLDAARAADDHEWPWFLVRPSPAVLRLVDRTGTAGMLPLVAPSWRGDAVLDPAAAG